MKVMMFGWEFPPAMSGGLGTACKGLTTGLSNNNIDVTFVLPSGPDNFPDANINIIVANNVKNITLKKVPSLLVPYLTSEGYDTRAKTHTTSSGHSPLYGENLFAEVIRFSEQCKLIAVDEDFDVIHAHDWMTYPAGIKAKQATNKPLVVHIHATEFDRTGGNGLNEYVYNIEKEGFNEADKIIAVSNLTRNTVIDKYGIPPEKVEVVHNAVEFNDFNENSKLNPDDKHVLFLGRITLQKGPEYFLHAAKMVLDHDPSVKFIMAGGGDMTNRMIELAAHLGIGRNVLFPGWLKGNDIDRAYNMADLYVMPSVSEPFGITPLESIRNGTPALISNQSGVSEVLQNCLKTDFWDVNDMANKMLAALTFKNMHSQLTEYSSGEVRAMSWDDAAQKCVGVYNSVL